MIGRRCAIRELSSHYDVEQYVGAFVTACIPLDRLRVWRANVFRCCRQRAGALGDTAARCCMSIDGRALYIRRPRCGSLAHRGTLAVDAAMA